MEMMKEIFGELWVLLGDVVQLAWPEDPMLIGFIMGLLLRPAYRLMKSVPFVKSVVALGERAVIKGWSLTGGWLIAKAKGLMGKAKDAVDGALK
tara:strand:- start:313 stop:594 length:282 start_codon:yes stop_codon:yes gene_type:complete